MEQDEVRDVSAAKKKAALLPPGAAFKSARAGDGENALASYAR